MGLRRLKQQQRMESQLEFPKSAILTPYNYFEWKPKIQFHLRIRGLFRITMETEVEPTSAIKKSRYFNRMEEAFGILCLSISQELLFHVESCSTSNEVWKILERLFGKQDEIWQSFLFSLGHFDEDISHAPVDELVTKFPSPLIDEYADETSDQHSDDDESLFEEDPQTLLAMEPSMPMHAYMMHGSHQPAAAPSGPDEPHTAAAPSRGSQPSDDDSINLSALQVCIKCDMLKLENQIPLSVLKQVFEKGKNVLAYEHEREFSYLLKKAYTVLSPFEVGKADNKLKIDDTKSHLLDCMQAIVSPFLQMTADEKDNRPDLPIFQKAKYALVDFVAAVCGIFIAHPFNRGHPDFLTAYDAEQLDGAGIQFKSFSDAREQIRFDKNSGTFYLPRVTVSHTHTEVFLRNMMALEFNEPARPNSMTRYVVLMDCLIDTPRDVRLLRDCEVIRGTSLMLTYEHVAKMWDGMCQLFFTGHLEPPEELEQALQDVIKKYFKSRSFDSCEIG